MVLAVSQISGQWSGRFFIPYPNLWYWSLRLLILNETIELNFILENGLSNGRSDDGNLASVVS